MNTLSKTRAAAQYAARHAANDLTRHRAAVLLKRLGVAEAALAGTGGRLPVTVAGLLRALVLAVRDLAGKTWLAASGDDPDVAAFTALEATPRPPEAARIDQICAAVLWARYAPGGRAPARPPARKEASAMHTELAVERYEFTCRHCGARWANDYDVQHLTTHDGATWQYYSLNGTLVPAPTGDGCVACPACGATGVYPRLAARRDIPLPTPAHDHLRRKLIGTDRIRNAAAPLLRGDTSPAQAGAPAGAAPQQSS